MLLDPRTIFIRKKRILKICEQHQRGNVYVKTQQ